jgi:hypothetical protein
VFVAVAPQGASKKIQIQLLLANLALELGNAPARRRQCGLRPRLLPPCRLTLSIRAEP